jgi:hypothetical protein
MEIDTSIFWDGKRTLTYSQILFYIILGNRGGGKSYGAKEIVIDNFIKKREQFGYIRRYKEDLKEPMIQFFKDIENKYPDYEFKSDARYFYIREKPADPDEKWTVEDIAGYGFTLSTANNKKSISYPYITTLIFDEFLLDKGNQMYLSNEPLKLLSLYETIARPGTDHPIVKLFMLANATTITNPYFLFWDLQMPTKKDKNGKWIWIHPTRPILVENVINEKFIDIKKNTLFGSIIENTKYADFSIENAPLLDDDTFIEKRSGNCRFWCSFIYNNNQYGVWLDVKEGKMYVSNDFDPHYPIVYTITLKDHQPNTLFLRDKSKAVRFKTFIENFKIGNVRFESMNIKNITYEVIKLAMYRF